MIGGHNSIWGKLKKLTSLCIVLDSRLDKKNESIRKKNYSNELEKDIKDWQIRTNI